MACTKSTESMGWYDQDQGLSQALTPLLPSRSARLMSSGPPRNYRRPRPSCIVIHHSGREHMPRTEQRSWLVARARREIVETRELEHSRISRPPLDSVSTLDTQGYAHAPAAYGDHPIPRKLYVRSGLWYRWRIVYCVGTEDWCRANAAVGRRSTNIHASVLLARSSLRRGRTFSFTHLPRDALSSFGSGGGFEALICEPYMPSTVGTSPLRERFSCWLPQLDRAKLL